MLPPINTCLSRGESRREDASLPISRFWLREKHGMVNECVAVHVGCCEDSDAVFSSANELLEMDESEMLSFSHLGLSRLGGCVWSERQHMCELVSQTELQDMREKAHLTGGRRRRR
jgi:hypothetical protein